MLLVVPGEFCRGEEEVIELVVGECQVSREALFTCTKRQPVWISETSARAHVRFHDAQRNGLVKPRP